MGAMSAREFSDPPRRYFEDFQVGDVVLTRGRTVDVGDITAFAGLTGDHYPIHIDGLVGLTNFYGDAIVALLGIDDLRAKKPVLPGDTIRVRAEATAVTTRDSKRFGALEMTYTVLNQRDETVMQFVQKMLAKRRQEGGADE
jgi:acyl dehydratase